VRMPKNKMTIFKYFIVASHEKAYVNS
jgi:hypothetical protein